MDTDILVVNQCSFDKIDDIYRPAIEAAVSAYQQIFGADLINVRLLGSVARGEATSHSDIDFAALLNTPSNAERLKAIQDKADEMRRKHPFVSKVDLEVMPAEDLHEFRRFVFALDSLSLLGKDNLTQQSQVFNREKFVQMITPDASDIIENSILAIEKMDESDEQGIGCYSRVTGKDLLKCLRGEAILRGGEFERSVPRIYDQLVGCMPERQEYLAELLDLYVSPSDDKHRVVKALRDYEICE